MLDALCNQCGCKNRQARLNKYVPGLGDKVATVLNPIQVVVCKGENAMPDILKPDMKAIVWLAIGAFAVPFVLKMVK